MKYPCVHLVELARFAADQRVFRAFDHLIATRAGELLLLPVHLAEGDLRAVIDGCPVPWEEAWAALDTPVAGAPFAAERLAAHFPRLYRLFRDGWTLDHIGIGNSQRENRSLERMTHDSGVRFVWVRPAESAR